jgi:hypothetical protein
MKGNEKPYEERIKTNIGEDLFIAYCESKEYEITRIGFDEQNGITKNFWKISPFLRNLPDFFVNTGDYSYVVQVKGTDNFKKKEVDLLPLCMEWYSSKQAPLVYAFCFEKHQPLLKYPEQIIRLYQNSTDQTFPDGVVYRCLNLRNQKNGD